ncbi:MAG: leucyl aminopeptidase [Burkholderiales bacterium 35-55-47]|jgi:leucyl aminopeptidase|uniref:leucyl aminopeptidase n=1 Tax=Limnohabitans sp. TaxID=1907725 RepID=UPI000BCEE245|nr:leucyl aminopeptidase [Limnohabitans sp.]OYY18713.1 MAG: leucyl aminopeptidase [Burkholderiales bacterium 35-55-47]OYZ73531.1 MAG: leucyl aminopeptidase [Burkholderiales bacterium 24-55-52]OZB00677.1 MAG: leucyl aminopeptidase [Burkholderiales bacterium 39-55-53]HQR85577.1 leucyl aminopeptidase [Limnohabitans sp.]HQS26506.1 leucyl aminopeptidase [Limnohabitans sp.]
MNFELKTLDLHTAAAHKTDALIILVSAKDKPTKSVLAQLISDARKSGDLDESPAKLLTVWQPQGVSATRVVLVSCADGSAAHVRKAVTAAVGAVKAAKPAHLTVCLADAADQRLQAAAQAVADASYVYTATKPSAKASTLKRVTLALPTAEKTNAAKPAFEWAKAQVAGVSLAKEWGNRPANHATPTHLGDVAKALGKKAGIKCQVLGPKEIEKLGMGSFAAVARGSVEPLRFIVLEYTGAAKSVAPTVLVGKGITFDTGGISLKPGPGMDEMKFDMCGAASVLGTFEALSHLKPAINVVGLIPTCENMPDGTALKPGDVITSMSGQTIEVLNTDAEGRLILCDALTYATRFKPRAVIDIATLTGACVISLGHVRSGLFSPSDELANALFAAGEASLDPCWRLPLDEEYAEGLKSNFADVANIAGREAGSITAAKFLQRFAKDYPWAHLDIAGAAWKSGAAKGSTGRPVGLLLHYLMGTAKAK